MSLATENETSANFSPMMHYQSNDLWVRASTPMSATERDKCSLSSLIPMSCRDRAEAFARHLHSRLRSLDSDADGATANESSWLASHEASIAVSHQPRHHSDSELYFNFGLLDSPDSPDEEVTESELTKLINSKDNLGVTKCNNCNSSKMPNFSTRANPILNSTANSHDSDSSDGPYYDTESENYQKRVQHYVNGISGSPDAEDDNEDDTGQFNIEHHSTSCNNIVENHIDSFYESPLTSELSGLAQSCNDDDDDSTLSLKDEDCQSSLHDVLQIENQEATLQEDLNGEESISLENGTHDETLHVERVLTKFEITKCDTLEAQEDRPNECKAFLEVNSSNIFDDGDDNSHPTIIPRVRRCSSLKTGKTPPGTPGRKKIVRFADVLGLDLADVRTFLDEIPKIPTSAYDDLVDADLSISLSDTSLNSFQFPKTCVGYKADRLLFPLFQQPGGQPNFLDKVREKNVCLENAVVDNTDLSIKGTVRVRNLDFHKSVHIRYTLDSWKTYADLQTTYVANSCDGFSDTFTFLLFAHTLTVGQKLELAVRFHCKGCQYWDNNYRSNYCFQCLPISNNASYLSNGSYEDWGGSFY